MKLFKKYIFLLFMILFSCAVKAHPTGGLEDNKSPYILDVSPVNVSFGLSNKNSIEINFNEMIDPNSIKSSIDIYPDIPIKINRFGKKIIIKPQDKWPEDTSFKIKIKRGIADYFGNNLEKSKVLTYTTSNKNFSGYIEGKIYNISDKSVSLTIKKYASLAGLDPNLYGGHSLRSGFATSAAEAGAEERNIMAMTGHKTTQMVRRYIQAVSYTHLTLPTKA